MFSTALKVVQKYFQGVFKILKVKVFSEGSRITPVSLTLY